MTKTDVKVVSRIDSRWRLKVCLWFVRFGFWAGGFDDIEVTYTPCEGATDERL